jgi:hypothetical protein
MTREVKARVIARLFDIAVVPDTHPEPATILVATVRGGAIQEAIKPNLWSFL